jgi:hypothetical protein
MKLTDTQRDRRSHTAGIEPNPAIRLSSATDVSILRAVLGALGETATRVYHGGEFDLAPAP